MNASRRNEERQKSADIESGASIYRQERSKVGVQREVVRATSVKFQQSGVG